MTIEDLMSGLVSATDLLGERMAIRLQAIREQVDFEERRIRMLDMAQGVMGHCDFDSVNEDGGLACTMGIEEWLTWVQAVRKSFMESGRNAAPAMTVAFELYNLHHFANSIEEAAEHLFSLGARP